MAKLKIYNDITNEETKVIYEYWFGTESVCFKDVKEFVDNIPEDDNDIDLYLHCNGGDCIEGFAMYDTLRTSGKRITAVVDGMCASMATVLLMAAPKERRFAQKNATFLIHNPYCSYYSVGVETAHAEDLDNIAKRVQIEAEELRAVTQKILDLYVERTGTDADTLKALMDENKCIDSDKAMELGLIGEILEPNTDHAGNSINIKNMNKNQVTVEASLFSRMLQKLGISKAEDFKVVDQVITDTTGAELTVEREDGDPQVGDKASPDGEYTMEDGTVITVAEGVITAITPASDDKSEGESSAVDEKDQQITDLKEKVASLEAENATLKENQKSEEDKANLAKVVDLETENATLKENQKSEEDKVNLAKVVDLETENTTLKENQKSEEDKVILDKVAALGGAAWLEAAGKVSSTFTPENRRFKEHEDTTRHEEHESLGAGFLAEKRASRSKSFV